MLNGISVEQEVPLRRKKSLSSAFLLGTGIKKCENCPRSVDMISVL